MQDHWYGGGEVYKWGVAKPLDHLFSGLGNGYYNHISSNLNPWAVADREWKYWGNFDWKDPGDYGGAAYKYSGVKSVVDVASDVGCWVNPWCK
jgi:hypothetical protein